MKIFLKYLKEEKVILSLSLVAAAVNQIFSLFNPQIFGRIIDNYASQVGQFTQIAFIKGVGALLLLYVLFALVSRIAKAFQDYFVSVVSEKVGTSLYAKSVAYMFGLPFAVFEDQQSGSLLQKMQQARDKTKKLIGDMVNIGFFSLIGVVFVLVYAYVIHWSIGLMFTIAIPVMSFIISVLGERIKGAQQKIVARSAELAASTTETLQNVGLVKSLGLEDQEIKRLNVVNKQILGLEIDKVVIMRKLSFIQGTLVNLLSSTIILISMFLIFGDAVSLGQFLTLWFYGFFVFGPLSQISTLVSSFQEAKASLSELQKILDLKVETFEPEETSVIEKIDAIDFDNVSFTYGSGDRNVLDQFSFHLKAGETIAFVGPSGSGKSTLLKLVLGLYAPDSGTILYNNHAANQVDLNSIRHLVGYVPQDTQVFAGTVRDNLLFVAPEATDEACLDALEKAQALSIIARQDKGLDTIIGENGIKLSGGERQRIAIARALLRQPDVLIFDEATSSLDSLTEQEITNTIKAIRIQHPHLMMIIVAHRLSTVEHVDRLYAIKRGRLVESGTHQQLLGNKDLYYSLWNQQK